MSLRLTGFQRAVLGMAAALIALRLFFPVQDCFVQFGRPVCNADWSATYPQIVALVILAGALVLLFPSPNADRLRAGARAILGPVVLLGWVTYLGAAVVAWERGMRFVWPHKIDSLPPGWTVTAPPPGWHLRGPLAGWVLPDFALTAAAIAGLVLLVWLTRQWKRMVAKP